MSNPILHIKDSYYFEVPTALWKVANTDKAQFPDVWIKNDDQFQSWEFDRVYGGLSASSPAGLPDKGALKHDWEHWQHEGSDHANFAKPIDIYLEEQAAKIKTDADAWIALPENKGKKYDDYLATDAAKASPGYWFASWIEKSEAKTTWAKVKSNAGDKKAINDFRDDKSITWSGDKIAAYNNHLSGKIVLEPQPFGSLRNLYEAESGFAISKIMIVEAVIGIILFVVFSWLAGKVKDGSAPKGRLWNFLEVFLVFIRDQIARPTIGGHHEDHGDDHDHAPAKVAAADHHESGVHHQDGHAHAAHSDHGHGKKDGHGHHHNPYEEADRFVPLLWTIFFFVLTCNLFGLIPWLGGPTGSFAVTFALALITFATVVIAGMMKWGFVGFFLNQIPSMDLPLPLAVVLKPMIFAIEIAGLLIKHLVLSIRLLANMVAGHLVILGIMGLAFGAEGILNYQALDKAGTGWLWWVVAAISILGTTALNFLELFVAFLQAYLFTFLSALFIGASVHKH